MARIEGYLMGFLQQYPEYLGRDPSEVAEEMNRIFNLTLDEDDILAAYDYIRIEGVDPKPVKPEKPMKVEILNFNSIDDYMEFLYEYGIDFEQFAFLMLLITDNINNTDDNGTYRKRAHIYKFSSKVRQWNVDKIRDLEEKGLIIDHNTKHGSGASQLYPDMFEIEENFKEQLIASKENITEEFWKAYPKYLIIDGKQVRAKSLSCDKEDLMNRYYRIIQGSRKVHENIMKALEHDKRRGNITVGIEKYINSRQWEDTWEEMEKNTKREESEQEEF